MSTPPHVRASVLEALRAIALDDDTPTLMTSKLRHALLEFGSETPDNVSMANSIVVDQSSGNIGQEVGPKLMRSGILLSDLAWALEDQPIPAGLKDAFPDLTDKDWDAFTRLMTLLMQALTRPLADPSLNS